MDLKCRVDQLIDSNCHLELNSMNAGIVIIEIGQHSLQALIKIFRGFEYSMESIHKYDKNF